MGEETLKRMAGRGGECPRARSPAFAPSPFAPPAFSPPPGSASPTRGSAISNFGCSSFSSVLLHQSARMQGWTWQRGTLQSFKRRSRVTCPRGQAAAFCKAISSTRLRVPSSTPWRCSQGVARRSSIASHSCVLLPDETCTGRGANLSGPVPLPLHSRQGAILVLGEGAPLHAADCCRGEALQEVGQALRNQRRCNRPLRPGTVHKSGRPHYAMIMRSTA
jgi:hypothetical protein